MCGGKYFAGNYPTGSMAAARMFIWNSTPNLHASIAQSILFQSLPTGSLETQTSGRRYANRQYELYMSYTSMQPVIAPNEKKREVAKLGEHVTDDCL